MSQSAPQPPLDAPDAPRSRLETALGSFRAITPIAACLIPLLDALGWQGEPRRVAEALPHFAESLDLVGLRNVMAHLELRSDSLRVRAQDIDPRLLPCLFIADNGTPLVLRKMLDDGRLEAFDGVRHQSVAISGKPMRGTAFFFQQIVEAAGPPRTGWVATISARFRPLLRNVAAITFALYITAIASPLFMMVVYDRVIATGSTTTLEALLIGIFLAMAGEAALRSLRSRMLAYVGVRLNILVAPAVFQQILNLPPYFTERAKVGGQIARLKDFEFLKEVFSGHIAMTLVELPFVLVFVVVIAILAGWLAAVPMLAGAIYLGIAWLLAPRIREAVRTVGIQANQRQEFLVEMVTQMRALRTGLAEDTWRERFRALSSAAAVASYRNSVTASMVTAISQALMIGTGVLTMALGAEAIMEGALSTGALIASMTLVWRVLAPMQAGFIAYSRLEQMRASIGQIDNLMQLRSERTLRSPDSEGLHLGGALSLNRISMRYTNDGDPVLLGVSAEIPAGEMVALVGPNGAGKSSLLKVMMGLYQPQAGTMRIDDVDIRQRDPIELRKTIAYVPQDSALFFGTVAQNLRLAQPTASLAELEEAAASIGILDSIRALPEGFETRVGDQRSAQLPAALRHGLSLARAFLRHAPVYLIDEAIDALDADGDRAFIASMKLLRGKSTVVIVTHRPSSMRLADRLLVLDGGILRFNGPPDEILPQLPKNFL